MPVLVAGMGTATPTPGRCGATGCAPPQRHPRATPPTLFWGVRTGRGVAVGHRWQLSARGHVSRQTQRRPPTVKFISTPPSTHLAGGDVSLVCNAGGRKFPPEEPPLEGQGQVTGLAQPGWSGCRHPSLWPTQALDPSWPSRAGSVHPLPVAERGAARPGILVWARAGQGRGYFWTVRSREGPHAFSRPP